MIINIAKDFSETPGGRFINQGPFSGQLFRETILEGKFAEAIEKKEELLIDFDDTYGYATSFIEESFGTLTENNSKEIVLNTLRFKCEDQPNVINLVIQYIDEAEIRRIENLNKINKEEN